MALKLINDVPRLGDPPLVQASHVLVGHVLG